MSAASANNRLEQSQDIPTICYMCYSHCSTKARLVDGVLVDLEGNPEAPHNRGKLCAKGRAAIMGMYNPYRAKVPLRRTNPHKGIGIDPKWEEITWDEALSTIIEKLKAIREDDPRKLVLTGLDFHLSYFLFAFASAFGTPNVWKGGADYFCGNGVHPILYLTNAAFFAEPDLDHCNYCLLIGSQLGFMVNTNANTTTIKMAEARARGMKVVVVDPICTTAASKADEWVPIRPGTDGALALAMVNVLLNELGLFDSEFIKNDTNGPYLVAPDGLYVRDAKTGKPLIWDSKENRFKSWDAPDIKEPTLSGQYEVNGTSCSPAFQLIKDHVKQYTPEQVSQITTVPAATIRRIAREFAEAARIGSKIVIEGKELPYRPAAVHWNKGPSAHRHTMLSCLALQLLNIIVGAMDVPGGLLGCNPVGPRWAPETGPDGLIVPANYQVCVDLAYPAREVKRPETVDARELLPVGPYAAPFFEEVMLAPDRYGLPYQPEMLIRCHSNVMMSTSCPERIAEVLKRIPFIVSFSPQIDETAEFADLALPDAFFLERVAPFPNYPAYRAAAGQGEWYWVIGQPVMPPAGQARCWPEVLIELAHRLKIEEDLYTILNTMFQMKEPFKLDGSSKYNLEEITDLWAKSLFGPERDWNWFKEHGILVSGKKELKHAYPRPFLEARIPLYFEHFLKVGQEVKKVTQEMGIDWDTSDYQALPDWKPCPDFKDSPDPDELYAVNYKLTFHTFCNTPDNPWLDELSQHHSYAYKILINRQLARRKGISDGETVWVESSAGKVKGEARITDCVHPEVLGIAGTFGHWAKEMPIARDKGLHYNRLLDSRLDRLDTLSAALDTCVKVKVYKASG